MGAISSALLSGVLNQDISFTNKPESVKAQDILDSRFTTPGTKADSTEFFVVQSASSTVADPQFEARVTELKGQIDALGGSVLAGHPTTYYDVASQSKEAAAGLVSKDGRTTLISVGLKDSNSAAIEKLRGIADGADGNGFTVQVAGQGTLGADFTKIAEEDLRKGESIGIGIALIVLIVVFAAVVAAVVPIVMALFAIAVALGLVSPIGQLFQFNLFVTNMITMIGLAVGIDYSLFIVSRYRGERKKGFDKLEAIGGAGATANRAVFFSGLTVVLALLGMLIIPTTIFRALAGGAILVTLAALAASMTLLPAILALLGDRINWPRLSKRAKVDSSFDPRGGVWDRITRGVMARPAVFLIASLLVLGGLGSFYFQLHRGTSQNVSQLSDDIPSKKAFLTLEREFSGGLTDPAQIVIVGDVKSASVQSAIAKLQQSGADASHVAIATGTSAVVVSLSDGKTRNLDADLGSPVTDADQISRPVVVDGCVHAAWAGTSGGYVRSCDGRPATSGNLKNQQALVHPGFRVNRGSIVLNDLSTGAVWDLSDGGIGTFEGATAIRRFVAHDRSPGSRRTSSGPTTASTFSRICSW